MRKNIGYNYRPPERLILAGRDEYRGEISMAEQLRPPLQEITPKPLKKEHDAEGELITLVNSIKESLDTKILALRKDLDRKVYDQISHEFVRVQDAMEKLRDDHDRKAQEQVAADLVKLHDLVEKLQAEGEDTRVTLSAQVASLAEKVEAITATVAAPAKEVEQLKHDVQSSIKQVQGIVSKFDLPLFINDIRDAFSVKVTQAEERASQLASQLVAAQQEIEQLRLEFDEKEARALEEIDQLKGKLASKDAEIRRLQQAQAQAQAQIHIPAPAIAVSRTAGSPGTLTRIPSTPVPYTGPIYNLDNPARETEIPYPGPGSDATKKAPTFCINCGTPRGRSAARFCIFCGNEYLST
jgi:DNA repair exonuclease SbcCD ATPase subunit